MIAYFNLATSWAVLALQISILFLAWKTQRMIKRSTRNQDEQIRILRARIHMLEQVSAAHVIPFPREGRA
jgi:hypothetical protein